MSDIAYNPNQSDYSSLFQTLLFCIFSAGGDGVGYIIADDYLIYADEFRKWKESHTVNGYPIGLSVEFSGDGYVGFSDGSNENLVFSASRDVVPIEWKPEIVVELL